MTQGEIINYDENAERRSQGSGFFNPSWQSLFGGGDPNGFNGRSDDDLTYYDDGKLKSKILIRKCFEGLRERMTFF